LASSRISSSSADWRDIVGNLVAFEAINNVRLRVRLETGDLNGYADLLVDVTAEERSPENGEAKVLASVQLKCSDMRSKNLEAVVIRALYALDARLAGGAFDVTINGA
jgi:hypothetical protein